MTSREEYKLFKYLGDDIFFTAVIPNIVYFNVVGQVILSISNKVHVTNIILEVKWLQKSRLINFHRFVPDNVMPKLLNDLYELINELTINR